MKAYVARSLPLDDIDYEDLFSIAVKASNALARYDGLLQGLVNPDVLMAPLSVQEAQYSSRIEDIYATVEDILTQEAGGAMGKRPTEEILDIHEVLNYRRTLQLAQNSLAQGQPLNLHFIRAMHQTLMKGARGSDKSPGQFRNDQNWIGAKGCSIEEAIFVPVSPLELDKNLSNLISYIESDDRDAIAQAAIVHAQFELIHPFRDGNGRVGRLLIPLFLSKKKILSAPMFYLSGYLERNRQEYLNKLTGLSKENDWQSWLHFFYRAVIEQSEVNSEKVNRLIELYSECKTLVRNITGSKYSDAITDGLFQGPIFSRPQLQKLTQIPQGTLYKQIDKLEDAEVIQTHIEGSGTIPTTYFFPKLLKATSELAMRRTKD